MADFALTRGDDEVVILTFNIPSVRDISNDRIDFVVKKKPTDTASLLTKSTEADPGGISLTTPLSGVAQVAIDNADLNFAAREGEYNYSARLTKNGNGDVHTTTGTFTVRVVP